MPALKLFVSHSSRLDDIAHKYTRDDHNWRLLEDTCGAIRQKYGERVEVLVDKEGLEGLEGVRSPIAQALRP